MQIAKKTKDGRGQKRKLEQHDTTSQADSANEQEPAEVVGEQHTARYRAGQRQNQQKKQKKAPPALVNTVGSICLTTSGSLLICSTLEDKTVRVLDTETLNVINEW